MEGEGVGGVWQAGRTMATPQSSDVLGHVTLVTGPEPVEQAVTPRDRALGSLGVHLDDGTHVPTWSRTAVAGSSSVRGS